MVCELMKWQNRTNQQIHKSTNINQFMPISSISLNVLALIKPAIYRQLIHMC